MLIICSMSGQPGKIYEEQLRKEVNAERAELGKSPIDDDEDDRKGGGTAEKTVSTTDPDCGMFVKGEHERQFAYEAHTACDKNGMVLAVEVTAGNVSDSVAWDAVYDKVTGRFDEAQFIVMDAGYKTPWIAKKILDDSRIPILPYTQAKTAKGHFRPWEYKYDVVTDTLICPHGKTLRHTTTDRDGKRIYRSTPSECRNCPRREGWRELAQVLAANTGSTAAPVASGKTDANGSITFTGLAAGMYLIMGDSVRRNNVEYTPNPFVVTLTEGQSLVCQVKGAETPYDPVVKSVTVKKVWANDRMSVRPTGVVIQLLQNGTVYDTQVLSAATGWTYTWRELDAEKTWSVRESSVPPGYTASIKREGDVFTVTNTYTASTLPSGIPGTGDDAQMALYLAAALTSLAAFAVLAYTYRKRRGEQ